MVNKKSQIHFQWLFRIILFMTITFLIITSFVRSVDEVFCTGYMLFFRTFSICKECVSMFSVSFPGKIHL